MKKLLQSLTAFFAGKTASGTAIEIDETNETVTLARADAELLLSDAVLTADLITDLETANGTIETLTTELATAREDLAAAQSQLTAAFTEMGIAADADLVASIKTLKQKPGNGGANAAANAADAVVTDAEEVNPYAAIEAEKRKRMAAFK